MKLPRISVGAIMTGLVIVALDCAVVRSIWARPDSLSRDLGFLVFGTLPMANVFTVVLSTLARGRIRSRPSLVGFVVGSGLALVATMAWMKPALLAIGSALHSAGILDWSALSPVGQMVAQVGFVGGLPLAFQATVGLACGWLAGRFRAKPTEDVAIAPPWGLHPRRALVVLIILAALPPVVVEGILRRTVDPMLSRLAVGSLAVFGFDEGWREIDEIVIPANSPIRPLLGAKVRIEADRDPYVLEAMATDDGGRLVRDHRPVRVKFLDGPEAGETTDMPHSFLRPLR